MADICAFDKSNPLLRAETLNGRIVTKYEPLVALTVCEMIADGQTLKEIFSDRNRGVVCTQRTFFSWVVNHAECARAFDAARVLSAFAFEDEALVQMKELKDMPGSPQKVAAYRAYADQLRWSAARRNPTVFSEKAPVNVVVPIQINTTLDMGRGDGAEKKPETTASVYEMKAELPVLRPDERVEEFQAITARDLSGAPEDRLARPKPGAQKKRELIPNEKVKKK